MKAKFGTALAIAVLTLLTYFAFPGHTYLTQDTQIYVPILEHLWDPSVLARDILVERPHVAFTVYDEVAIGLRRLTHSSFREVLTAQQILYRGLGLWGIYLMAVSALSSTRLALLTTAIFALGADVPGPAVLLTEYEPTPRAFAIPLLFLATGLVAQRRYVWAGIAASAAFLYHPPSVVPFWIVYLALAVMPGRRELWAGIWPLLCAIAVLLCAAHFQTGLKEEQVFFSRISGDLEILQRLRGPYNWVSLWWDEQWKQYAVLTAVGFGGLWRTRRLLSLELRAFLVGLPLAGLLSVPASYLLLDHLKWSLMPQLQPARGLLFVVATALLASAVAACDAARNRRWSEALGWFMLAILIPMHARVDSLPSLAVAATVLGLSVLACAGAGPSPALTPVAALAGFVAIPLLAHVNNYIPVENPDLRALSAWARTGTPQVAVFLFPGPPKSLEPGVFRSEALRSVYVDWKGGGQVNYLKELGEEWWTRYQATVLNPFTPADLPRFARLGIDYVVLSHALDRPAAFSNSRYRVYRTAP